MLLRSNTNDSINDTRYVVHGINYVITYVIDIFHGGDVYSGNHSSRDNEYRYIHQYGGNVNKHVQYANDVRRNSRDDVTRDDKYDVRSDD